MERVNLTLIHNRRGTGSSEKPVSVEIRFTMGKERRYVSTGVKVTPSQWSKENKRVIRRKDADELNGLLNVWIEKARNVVSKFTKDETLPLSKVQDLMSGEDSKRKDFATYCEERAEKRNVRSSTRGRYMVFVRFLRKWGKITSFSDAASESRLRDMDEHLHKKGYKQSTIYDYHKFMKLFINDACIEGLMERNPYNRLSFKVERGEKEFVDCITEEQFRKLKTLEMKSNHLMAARDLFLFQCYTAMAYSDMMSFDYGNCVVREGKMFYHAKRTKTDTDFVFILLEPAVEILEKYNYKLPIMSNQKYNDYLKIIGVMIGYDGLHSHAGRGTAATLFLSKGMPINVVQKVMGHKSIRQTLRYARTLNKDVIGAFDNLEGKL